MCGGSEISIQFGQVAHAKKSASMDCESAFFFTAKKGGLLLWWEVQRELETSLEVQGKGTPAKSLHVHVIHCVVHVGLHAKFIHVQVYVHCIVDVICMYMCKDE